MELSGSAALLIIGALVLGGLAMGAVGAHSLWLLRRSRDWPSTPGSVVSTEIRKRITAPGSVDPTSHGWYPQVTYEYRVEDETLRADVIELCGRLRMTPRMAGLIAASYPVGRDVTVYYDPQRPERACLVRGGGGAWGKVIGGGFLAGLGLLFWLG